MYNCWYGLSLALMVLAGVSVSDTLHQPSEYMSCRLQDITLIPVNAMSFTLQDIRSKLSEEVKCYSAGDF